MPSHDDRAGDPATATVVPEALPQADLLDLGTVLAGRYRITGHLGSGGFAHVYAAFDTSLDRAVAVKVLHGNRIASTDLVRFHREVNVAHQVSSDHLVRVFDLSEHGDLTFLTMELVDGESLKTRLARGPLDVEDCIRIGADVLRGLSALHGVGVIHRDVKPGNVLLGAGGEVKLADYGLARSMAADASRATRTDALVGTLDYLAPEQALGRPCDARTDLYSFGILLFEMLTGRTPFDAAGTVATALAHVQKRPPSLRRFRRDAPRWLASLVSRLLEKEPARRPASADAVLLLMSRRKAMPDARAAFRAALAAVVLLSAGALVWRVAHNAPAGPPRVAAGPHGGIEVRDGRGKLLWSRPDSNPRFTQLVSLGPDAWGVAAVSTDTEQDSPARTARFRLFAADSGELLLERPMPDASQYFPAFSNEFHLIGTAVVDHDHDGWSEVVLELQHLYYPAYMSAIDTRTHKESIVFIASGHHRTAGTADVNGDGFDELIVIGTANRLGWYTGLGAIDLHATLGREVAPATTPDGEFPHVAVGSTLWYALLPHATISAADVQVGGGVIRIRYPERPPMDLGLDGFLRGSSAPAVGPARELARDMAYDALRTAKKLADVGDHDRAVDQVRRAVASARNAGDALLEEWSRRVEIVILIRTGHYAEAGRLTSEAMGASDVPNDVAFDAAHALHLAGRLDEAMRWYRAGLHAGMSNRAGRLRYEFLEGGVLALAERHRWREAMEWVDEYERAYPVESMPKSGVTGQAENANDYRNFVRWRRADPASPPQPIARRVVDLPRYWDLEIQYAHGAAPAALLPLVRQEAARDASATGMILSLEAQLLFDLRQRAEAAATIVRAAKWIEKERPTNTAARAHAEVVEARRKRIIGS